LTVWRGKDWEEHINSLLRLRYPLGDYQEVPDEHGGDHGIEGFSSDGCAYQCYAPREPLSVRTRYEAHRDKLTDDIGKFTRNGAALMDMLGPLRIRRWIFVVPRHDSGMLVAHAEKKAREVRAENPPHVDETDFRISIVTDEHFAHERAALAGVGAIRIHIPLPELEGTESKELEAAKPTLVENLSRKVEGIEALGPQARDRLRQSMMTYYVQGQVILERLRRDYPDIFDAIMQEKTSRARRLELDSVISTEEPRTRIRTEMNAMQEAIEARFPNISPETRVGLAMESLSDWLLTCPLDFPVPS
jgi:hypothetical protein